MACEFPLRHCSIHPHLLDLHMQGSFLSKVIVTQIILTYSNFFSRLFCRCCNILVVEVLSDRSLVFGGDVGATTSLWIHPEREGTLREETFAFNHF